MNDKSYPKYQADWTVGTRMFHVRCDDINDFQTAITNMEAIIPSNKPFPDDEGNRATSPENAEGAPECGIHHIPMTWRPAGVSKTTGKHYPGFWSCPEKVNGNYCSYRAS